MPEPKLVRDGIPEIIRASGKHPHIEVLSPTAYLEALHAKLDEEVAEVHSCRTPPELAEEVADVLEVLRALVEANSLDWAEIEDLRERKLTSRGGFTERVLLLGTSDESVRGR
jgi:predicted house-cleaning noncanonical NTP pyrophosphatase (MazG superfamily)